MQSTQPMNPVIEKLLQSVDEDPLPDPYTSSHWKLYGGKTTVARLGEELLLEGHGFESPHQGVRASMGKVVERLSYRKATAPLNSYASVWRSARGLARELSFDLTFYVWRQAVALSVLTDHWNAHKLEPRTFALIGDGHGFLGALVRRRFPGSRIYCIDLPKTLVFQARTHEMAEGPDGTAIISEGSVVGDGNVVLVPPQEIEMVADDIDAAVNMVSMQEMNDFTIATYFEFLRRRSTSESRFYCVNRLRKELPGGEVTNFNNYPWSEDDDVFLDGPCPYHTHVIGSATLPRGPRLLGMRVPFVNYFDGVIMHRLVHLARA